MNTPELTYTISELIEMQKLLIERLENKNSPQDVIDFHQDIVKCLMVLEPNVSVQTNCYQQILN